MVYITNLTTTIKKTKFSPAAAHLLSKHVVLLPLLKELYIRTTGASMKKITKTRDVCNIDEYSVNHAHTYILVGCSKVQSVGRGDNNSRGASRELLSPLPALFYAGVRMYKVTYACARIKVAVGAGNRNNRKLTMGKAERKRQQDQDQRTDADEGNTDDCYGLSCDD